MFEPSPEAVVVHRPAAETGRPRVLLGVFSCHPDNGSEQTVGWNRIVEATRFGEVEAITHVEDNVEAVRRALDRDALAGVRVHFLPLSRAERALLRAPGTYYAGYRLWHRRALRLAEQLHAERPFDVVHQATLCGYREPGELWRLGVPFVWGPVGGTQNTPAAYLRYGGPRMTLREGLRSALNKLQLRTSRRVRHAARHAAAVLVANSTGRADFAQALGVEATQQLETGVRDIGRPKRWADRAPGPFRLLWAGDVVQRKGIRLALDALAVLRAPVAEGGRGLDVKLIVVGDGADRDVLPSADGVDWRGWIPRADLLALYHRSDALAFTSLRDTSGNVMLEALAAGLPVVYLDHQGARDMGSAACGIPVEVSTPAASVAGLIDGVASLATDPSLYDRLSAGAIARAHALSWRANGDAVNAIYARLSGQPAEPEPTADVEPSSAPSDDSRGDLPRPSARRAAQIEPVADTGA